MEKHVGKAVSYSFLGVTSPSIAFDTLLMGGVLRMFRPICSSDIYLDSETVSEQG